LRRSLANGELHQACGHVLLSTARDVTFGHMLNITWPQAWWSSPLASETSQL